MTLWRRPRLNKYDRTAPGMLEISSRGPARAICCRMVAGRGVASDTMWDVILDARCCLN